MTLLCSITKIAPDQGRDRHHDHCRGAIHWRYDIEALNILVTGGAGFIGSHLVDGLLTVGHKVRVLDVLTPQVHPSGDWPSYLDLEAERIRGDVRDADVVQRALENVDVVFHQAAFVGVGQSMYEIASYVSANTMGAAVLLEAIVARRDRIRKMVVASSMSIYGEGRYRDTAGSPFTPLPRSDSQLVRHEWEVVGPDGLPALPVPTDEEKPLQPTSVYAITKRDHEELFLSVGRAYGIPAVALRYFNVYGPRQALSNPYTGVAAIFSSRFLANKQPVIYEDGHQTRDFVHVSDIVQANILAISRSDADYSALNVGTGQPVSVRQVASALAVALRKDDAAEITGQFRAGDIRHCTADISRAGRMLGYTPKVRFQDGTAELVDWVSRQVADDRFEMARDALAARKLIH